MVNLFRSLLIGISLFFQITDALSADEIKIAYIAGLSGPLSLVSQERLKTFMAAADRVNASGFLPGGAKS